MNAQPIIGDVALRILSPRDWLELSREWLSKEQAKLEASMKRAGAAGIDVAREVERFAESHSTFGVLVAMCRNLEGSMMIIDRSAARAGISRETLDAAMVGVQPEDLMMCAYRCMGFKVASDDDAKSGDAGPNE